ncbi:hypothetical protein PINS_up004689 [Pythium insidiosum]|nr:hypothetical protein PINS_up004689 [Pythium insidiosum]
MATTTLLSFLLVSALWGCTNPLIKRGSRADAVYTRRDNSVKEWLAQALHWIRNWQFVVPFLLNQSGSVAFVHLLASAEISSAVPICNSLTFVFTAITSRVLGEVPRRPLWTYTGVALILAGVFVCFQAKALEPR